MDIYENAMVEPRVQFANRIHKLIQLVKPENLGFFLLYYAALSSNLHQPMEAILKEASQRCQEMHFADSAAALNELADRELEQHQVMHNDTEQWIAWWNVRQELNLSPKDYLHHPMMPSMQAYFDLHEDIAQQWPFAELAITYEIQRIQTIHSFSLIKLIVFKLGLTVLRKLAFVRRAAKFNSNQSLNKKLFTAFLQKHPETLSLMVEKASASLSVYADFIEDCFQLADNEAKKYQLAEVVG